MESAFSLFTAYFALLRADALGSLIGTLGAAILMRIMGFILAFLAVQYMVDGITSRSGLNR